MKDINQYQYIDDVPSDHPQWDDAMTGDDLKDAERLRASLVDLALAVQGPLTWRKMKRVNELLDQLAEDPGTR